MYKSIIIIISIFGILIPCFSQEDLSIEDAIRLGIAQNFDIIIANKNIDISKNNNTWGQAGRYPTIDLNFQQGNNISDQSNNPTAFIKKAIRSHSLQSGLTLNWTLFNGFKVLANKEKLELLEEQSEGNASVIVENTIQSIILSYYTSKLQLEKISLLKSILKLSEDKYKHQKIKQEMGVAVTIDILQYKSAYLTDSSSLVSQELAYKNSIRNLNLLMGNSIDKTWNLTSKLNTDMPIYDEKELVNKMESNSNNLKNQYINLELSKKELKLAKANLYPVLSFNASVQNTNSSFFLGNLSQNGSNVNYFGNFTLSFRLFNGGNIRRAIRNLDIQQEITNINLDKTKFQLNQELKIHLENYNTRITILDINKKAFEVSKQNLEIAELRENKGVINSFDLRDVEMNYLRTGVALFESMYSIIDSKTSLTKLTGGILNLQE